MNPSTSLRASQKGFTLMELIIYLGLFSLFVGPMTMAAYYMGDSITKTQNQLAAEQQIIIQEFYDKTP